MMPKSGYPVQIIRVNDLKKTSEKVTFKLDEHALEQILMKKEIRDLPAVVISVAGTYRSGKSSLLNYFIKYLKSESASRLNESWLETDNEPLTGFGWTNGPEINTRGILMWSEPFVVSLSSENKVAVLLIDTEGTFNNDYKCDQEHNNIQSASIFKFSNLISSVQIFNILNIITDDQLQFLQDCTEHGNTSESNESLNKPFQSLQFVIRDWFSSDLQYGSVGGKQLLDQNFAITQKQSKESKVLCEKIRSRFDNISCFLMPRPISKQCEEGSEGGYDGKISDLNSDFKMHLVDLVANILSPEKLVPKIINGADITVRDLFFYINVYTTMFNSLNTYNPISNLEATNKAYLLSEVDLATNIYETSMSEECGTKQASMPAVDVEYLHKKHVEVTTAHFNNKIQKANGKDRDRSLQKLIKNLDRRKAMFLRCNRFKTSIVVSKGTDYYDDELQDVYGDVESLCLHPISLVNLHDRCLKVAVRIFDQDRKRVTKEIDEDRNKFIESFDSKYQTIKLINERNNNLAVAEAIFDYYEFMNTKTDPPIPDEDLKKVNETAIKRACDSLQLKRSRFNEDVCRSTIKQRIADIFEKLRELNKAKVNLENLNKLHQDQQY